MNERMNVVSFLHLCTGCRPILRLLCEKHIEHVWQMRLASWISHMCIELAYLIGDLVEMVVHGC